MGGVHHHAERTGLRAEHLIIAGFQIGFVKLRMLASSSTIRILYLLLPIVLTPSFQSKAEYRAAATSIFCGNVTAVRLDDGGAHR